MGKVILVRHGQASFGADDYDCLSTTGVRQAQRMGQVLPPHNVVVSGTMLRHLQTARAALPDASITEDAGWNELDYLDVIRPLRPDLATHDALIAAMRAQAEPHRAFQRLYSTALQRWASGQHDTDYSESRTAFCARVLHALNALADARIVFTSGGPIAAIVQAVLGLSEEATRGLEMVIANASMTTVIAGETPRLITFNAYTHLEHPDDLITYR
jgi:broad specificity phosphatase PhoE